MAGRAAPRHELALGWDSHWSVERACLEQGLDFHEDREGFACLDRAGQRQAGGRVHSGLVQVDLGDPGSNRFLFALGVEHEKAGPAATTPVPLRSLADLEARAPECHRYFGDLRSHGRDLRRFLSEGYCRAANLELEVQRRCLNAEALMPVVESNLSELDDLLLQVDREVARARERDEVEPGPARARAVGAFQEQAFPTRYILVILGESFWSG